jgi:DeoR family fructose operon transcriptional repressor
LFAAERRHNLLTILRSENKIDVSESAKRLGTSHETIRKDIMALESQGLLRRVHGGALPVHTMTFELDVTQRPQNIEEKRRASALALGYLPAQGAIFIDSGSTTQFLAELSMATSQLTVFTNAISIAQTILTMPEITCNTLGLGGRLRGPSMAEVGPWALRALSDLRIDVAFVGTNAISFDRGLPTPDTEESAVKASILEHAEKSILLVDHSKFNENAMISFASLNDLDIVITGKELDAESKRNLEACDIEVLYA